MFHLKNKLKLRDSFYTILWISRSTANARSGTEYEFFYT